ncbi:ankyrin repeat and zinc finger domain-containing protein 1-like [Scleropages formosus]|uniref:Ankyrin repeat and zinc finger domain-containing protein 1-like n=1 Tax=Scleropages formosus TaxID=113540 RepID=A0A0P7V6P2_SCLFO|nr:ankyrin repeat and zinc finger domain-containing protein 1-like [Scleropages formosus]
MTAIPDHRSVFDSLQDETLLEGLEEVFCTAGLPSPAFSTKEVRLTDREEQLDKSLRQGLALGEVSEKMFCSICQCPFENREEQMEHYKLDWHRFNLRQKLVGRSPVTVEDFEKKTSAGDMSSISGSDSEGGNYDADWGFGDDDDSTSVDAESPPEMDSGLGRLTSRVLFRNSQGQYLSVFRCVLHSKKLDPVGDLAISLLNISNKSVWVVLMTGGGHFAGAVFQGKEVLQHKTFHRYTVRAKRGTAQGLRDSQNRGHAPKSAGAALRRYNEAALVKDVQELLQSWSEHLREASAIFLRIPSYNRAMFFGVQSPLLSKTDPRVRTLPFATRRATFREVKRVHELLSTLHVYGRDTEVSEILSSPKKVWKEKIPRSVPRTHADAGQEVTAPRVENEERSSEEESPAVDLEVVEETLGTLDLREFEICPHRRCQKKKRRRRKKKKKEEEEEEEEEEDNPRSTGQDNQSGQGDDWGYALRDAFFTACKVGDLEALQRLLQDFADHHPGGGDPGTLTLSDFLNAEIDYSGFTLLHVASAAGQRGVVRRLMDAGSDPAHRDKKGRTPYAVAAERDTRNEFRRYMAEYPDKYDYSKAQVPAPLTGDIELKKAEKKRAQKATKKQREKEQKEEQRREEAEQEERRRFAALSDREKRALAAERRLEEQLASTGGTISNIRRCWWCGDSLLGKVPFHYLDFSFCSTCCLQEHRKSQSSSTKP